MQEPTPFLSLQLALAPQGEGLHGDILSVVANSLSCTEHSLKGSPVNPGLHIQIGLCCTTLQ